MRSDVRTSIVAAVTAGALAFASGQGVAQQAVGSFPKSGDTFRDCDGCPEMVVIPAGSFMMGSPASERERTTSEQAPRRVMIAKSFAAGKFEVTFAEWDACVSARGCTYRPNDKGWGKDRRPVMNVSWNDAKSYIAWLSRKTGKLYRLLSEAEWEYAARAGTTTARYWGDSPSEACVYANVHDAMNRRITGYSWETHACDDEYAHTAPVGSFQANGFGLHDMLGNVWEWVEDCWQESHHGGGADGSARVAGGDCGRRVVRGGGWYDTPRGVRSAARKWVATENQFYDVGFRLARTLD